MKIKDIILILCLSLLCSCAEEDLYGVGVLECSVEVSMVLPTSAEIKFSIPNDMDNILKVGSEDPRICLIDRPLNPSEDFWKEVDFTFHFSLISKNEQNNLYQYFCYDLQPNKTYYVLLRTPMSHMDEGEGNDLVYYTNCSFTTPKEGDLSAFPLGSEIKCELDSNWSFLDQTRIKLSFPSKWSCDIKNSVLLLSEFPNMQDPIKSVGIYIGSNDHEAELYEYIFSFPKLAPNIYYLEFQGTLSYSYYASYEDVKIDITNCLDLTSLNK